MGTVKRATGKVKKARKNSDQRPTESEREREA
jgi:hypothetical protein